MKLPKHLQRKRQEPALLTEVTIRRDAPEAGKTEEYKVYVAFEPELSNPYIVYTQAMFLDKAVNVEGDFETSAEAYKHFAEVVAEESLVQ